MKKPAKKHKRPSTAVAVHKTQAPAIPPPATFLEFLDRAARDPNFEVAKFNAVLEAKAREDARNAETEFNEAMAAAQKKMDPIRADMASEKPRNKYASYLKLDRAIRPIYSEHGFALQFDTEECPHPLTVRNVCWVTRGAHKKRFSIDIPADGKGARGGDVMTATHAVGSAVTYGRGILLRGIFNLVVDKRDDDDGAAAGGYASEVGNGSISEAQAHEISLLMTETRSKTDLFLGMLSEIGKTEIKKIPDIPASLYKTAMEKLRIKKERMAQPAQLRNSVHDERD